MIGIHTISTKPKRGEISYVHLKKYELMTLILSCLYWKKFEGTIKLYCDTPFFDYISDLGLLWLWDEVDTHTIDNFSLEINPDLYWAFTKMYVNSLQTTPFCNMDLDFFSRHKIDFQGYDLVASHIEISDKIEYFYPNYIYGLPNKSFNVCFLYVSDLETYQQYYDFALNFALNNNERKEGSHRASLMTFVEQRLLYKFFENKKTKVIEDHLYDSNIPDFLGERKYEYFHLWNLKEDFITGFEDLKEYYTDVLDKEIANNFPKEHRMVRNAVFSSDF